MVLLGVVGFAATLAFEQGGCCSVETAGPGRPDGAQSVGSVERMFIEQMVPHHDQAIAMAELASEKAEHPELRDLAQEIVRTQSEENEQMREWYSDWFGETLSPGESGGMMDGMPGMMGREVDLDELEDADPFDKEFIEQMIPHHRMGIMMARMAGSSSGRDDFRRFTGEIVDVQSDEIDMMSGWYDEWYGR
ncbi:MAG: DUF305 domain-containing protein [Actinobacteria bacterium HGW-Actinobacteria-10]|jgi:uncharacterized protein (DUF305 family)|nr:MAG: DUF305 domain-containing protein [Actinobacteria bacterium HGW-Actinobacteria-10]